MASDKYEPSRAMSEVSRHVCEYGVWAMNNYLQECMTFWETMNRISTSYRNIFYSDGAEIMKPALPKTLDQKVSEAIFQQPTQ